jgi:hypothetical protein
MFSGKAGAVMDERALAEPAPAGIAYPKQRDSP